MPQVPYLDPEQTANPQGLMAPQGVTPEHVLMAASTMHDMGRLVEGGAEKSLGFGGKGSVRMPHRQSPHAGRGMRKLAEGGDVDAGETALVGEKGKEAFVPKASDDEKSPEFYDFLKAYKNISEVGKNADWSKFMKEAPSTWNVEDRTNPTSLMMYATHKMITDPVGFFTDLKNMGKGDKEWTEYWDQKSQEFGEKAGQASTAYEKMGLTSPQQFFARQQGRKVKGDRLPLPSRATGGRVGEEDNKVAIVGEEGPEVVKFDKPGTVIPLTKLAMEPPKDPFSQKRVGEAPGGGMEGPGRPTAGGTPEIQGPKEIGKTEPSLHAQYKQITDQYVAVQKLRPMVPTLIKLGVTPDQMTKMNPAEAYKFIKARSPGGMGKVNPEEAQMVDDVLDKLSIQRRILHDKMVEFDPETGWQLK